MFYLSELLIMRDYGIICLSNLMEMNLQSVSLLSKKLRSEMSSI